MAELVSRSPTNHRHDAEEGTHKPHAHDHHKSGDAPCKGHTAVPTIVRRASSVDDVMVPLEEKLAGLLYRLKCDKAGETLGEEELRGIRESLGHVDAMYHEGYFHLPGVEGVPSGQGRAAEMLAQAHELIQERMEAESAATVDSRLHFFQHTLSNMNAALDDLLKDEARPHQAKDLAPYRTRLSELDAKFQQVKSKARVAGESPLDGEEVVKKLISSAFQKLHTMLLKTDYYRVDPRLHWLHDRLVNVIHGLEALEARGWGVTEEELQKYCMALAKIEKHSHEGVFYVDGEMPEGQAVMAELIGAAHKLVHKISNNMA